MAMHVLNSAVLFHTARAAYDRQSANDILVTVVFAALGLEGFVNETLARATWKRVPASAQRVAMVAAAAGLYKQTPRLRDRIAILTPLLTGKPHDWTAAPYADVKLLLNVRNVLAHQRPEMVEDDDGKKKKGQGDLVGQLVARRVIPPPKDVIEVTFGVLSQPAVGRWAFNTALTAIRAIAAMFPEEGWGDKLLFAYYGVEPIP